MVRSTGAVAVDFHDVLQRHCFNCYSLKHFWLCTCTQKSKLKLNNLLFMHITFDELMSEIYNVLQ